MERNTIPAKKQYDVSAMGEFFRDIIAPEELRKELVELAFDYAQYVDEGSTDLFKNNMSTIYILYRALEDVKELETQGCIASFTATISGIALQITSSAIFRARSIAS